LVPEVRDVCESALRLLEGLGTEVVEVDDVFPSDPVGTWTTLASTYNLRTLEPFRGTEVWERVHPVLRGMVDWAATLPALEIVRAEDECYHLNHRLVEVLHGGSVLLTPTTATPPPLSGELPLVDGAPEPNWVRFTYPFNLTRSPAGTVCVGFTEDGLPIGMQVVGPQHGDAAVLRVLALLEDALNLDLVAPLSWAGPGD
jgi:Asp-tRNA(Asn)/Glu-tRNA(Gln) amidotransferase A subunit family amidase